jgi:hypothetical protein
MSANRLCAASKQKAARQAERRSNSISANLTVSPLVTFRFLAAAKQNGITKYMLQATLDSRTSDICIELNGRIFEVNQAAQLADQIMQATDPDELRALAPFVPGNKDNIARLHDMSDEELQAAGVMIPPFHPFCYADGTRVFTKRGLIGFAEVDVETDSFLSLNPETRRLEWVKAQQKLAYPYKGKMLRVSNAQKSVNMLVTPDHTLFFDRRIDRGLAGRVWETGFGPMSKIEKHENKLYVTSVPEEGSPDKICRFDAVKLCRLLGYILSDGYVKDGVPIIVQHNPQKRAIMEAHARETWWHVLPWKNRFAVKIPWIQHLLEACSKGAYNKEIPEVVFGTSIEARRAFLDAFRLGDGSERTQDCFGWGSTERVYRTTSPKIRDGLIRLLIGLGRAVSLHTEEPKSVKHHNGTYTAEHPLFILQELTSERRSASLSEEDYEGMVYDVSLEKNHTLLVEHKGRFAWGSNCHTVPLPVGEVTEPMI